LTPAASCAESTSSCSTNPRAAPFIQFVDAGSRVLDQLQDGQQHLALIGQSGSHCAGNVLVPDERQARIPTSGVSRTILDRGFPFREVHGLANPNLSDSPGKPPPSTFNSRWDTSPLPGRWSR
jgi:hypothetical protein